MTKQERRVLLALAEAVLVLMDHAHPTDRPSTERHRIKRYELAQAAWVLGQMGVSHD